MFGQYIVGILMTFKMMARAAKIAINEIVFVFKANLFNYLMVYLLKINYQVKYAKGFKEQLSQ